MAKKLHIQSHDNVAKCGVVTTRFIDSNQSAEKATCIGCRQRVGLSVPEKSRDAEPDWSRKCEVCGQSPVMPFSGMCGPCTTGEADTAFGNW